MEQYPVTPKDNLLQIHGLPDAAALVQPTDKFEPSIRLKHIALHQRDLYEVGRILQYIKDSQDDFISMNLWELAVVKAMKCFKRSSSRSNLSFNKIFPGDTLSNNVCDYFMSLRDKFIVHDDNGYQDCNLGLVISRPGKDHKIERVVTGAIYSDTLSQDNFNNLFKLVNDSLEWLNVEYDSLCKEITAYYESLDRDDLMGLPVLKFNLKIGSDDVHENRGKF